MVDISEKHFEQTIETVLIGEPPQQLPGGASPAKERGGEYGLIKPGGYRKRAPEDYDKRLCLIPADVFDFLYATQPKEWEKFKKQHGGDAKDRLLTRLTSEVKNRGTLEVLRKGIKSDGCSFRLAYFRPSSGLNEELQKLYEANLLPFNQGRNGGAGNSPAWNGFPTAYLWERIWSRDSVLNLIQHFVQVVEEEDDKGRKTGERSLILPPVSPARGGPESGAGRADFRSQSPLSHSTQRGQRQKQLDRLVGASA